MGGELKLYFSLFDISAADIRQYLIRGLWYFDKRQGELKYRLLGIAPAAPDVNFLDSDDEANKEPNPLFWVFFPDAREVLHRAHPIKNGFASYTESYDYILNIRDFTSVIIKEENMYGNRSINEYIRGNSLFQLREAQDIKEEIRALESDMWTY